MKGVLSAVRYDQQRHQSKRKKLTCYLLYSVLDFSLSVQNRRHLNICNGMDGAVQAEEALLRKITTNLGFKSTGLESVSHEFCREESDVRRPIETASYFISYYVLCTE